MIEGDGSLHVFMVNVGQGDTTVVVTPKGSVIVIDAKGPSKLVKLLNDLGLNAGGTIEHFIVTHPHSDHFSGGNRLVREFEIAKATVAPFWFDFAKGPVTYRRLIKRFEENGTSTAFLAGYTRYYPDGATDTAAASGDADFSGDAAYLEMLGPTNGMIRTLNEAGIHDANHLSIISRLNWGKFRMIIGADAQLENWSQFDRERMLEGRCQVLRSAHHGSKNGTQWERIARLRPRVVVVSSDPESGHCLPDLNGAAIFAEYNSTPGQMAVLTSDSGTIYLKVDSNGMTTLKQFGDGKNEKIGNLEDDDFDPRNGGTQLDWTNNPTDWGQLLRRRVDQQ